MENNKLEPTNHQLSRFENKDIFYLDDENIIYVTDLGNRNYQMQHLLLISEDESVVLNEWTVENYAPKSQLRDRAVIKEYNFFQIPGHQSFLGLYDYKNCKFIVPVNVVNELIKFGLPYVNGGFWDFKDVMRLYSGILIHFGIHQEVVIDCINQHTGQDVRKSIMTADDIWYAVIELDGTVRNNQLIRKTYDENENFKVTEVANLDDYGTIQNFVTIRKMRCNIKNAIKQQEFLRQMGYTEKETKQEDLEQAEITMSKKKKEQ